LYEKRSENPGNIPESMCVAACTMVENKISKYVKGVHGGTHTYKISKWRRKTHGE
jgi:hypothetical protein